MPPLHVQRPAFLLGLLLVPVLAWLWARAAGRVRRACRALGVPTRPNAARGALRLVAFALLVVGGAGPVWMGADGEEAGGAPVVFVLDVSRSMSAYDAEPNRLAAARGTIERIAGLLPAARTALVAAAGDGLVVCPPTRDRAAFLTVLRATDAEMMSDRSSRLSAGLGAAARLLERDGGPGVVLLLSDGEVHGDDPAEAIRRMRRQGSVLHTVVVGTEQGGELPATPGGSAVRTQARPEAMAAWAAAGDGTAWRAGQTGERMPTTPVQVVSRALQRRAFVERGGGRGLSHWLYLVAALLLVAAQLSRGQESS
ncbi:MAG: VWA domain-containing protein [Candidatus Brocadiia bacterium]